MATTNFSKKNTNTIYAFGMNQYFTKEDVREFGLDADMVGEYDEHGTETTFQDAIMNAQALLQKRGWNTDYEIGESTRDCYDRIVENIIARKDDILEVAGCEIEITFVAAYECGYYEAAAFDVVGWHNTHFRNGGYLEDEWGYLVGNNDETPTEGDIIKCDWCNNVGLSKIHARRIVAAINEAKSKFIAEAEEALAEACDMKVRQLGITSNGSGVYKQIA